NLGQERVQTALVTRFDDPPVEFAEKEFTSQLFGCGLAQLRDESLQPIRLSGRRCPFPRLSSQEVSEFRLPCRDPEHSVPPPSRDQKLSRGYTLSTFLMLKDDVDCRRIRYQAFTPHKAKAIGTYKIVDSLN